MQQSICELVRDLEKNYTTGTTSISEYVDFDQYENINKIEAYLNSKHISGSTDSMGREKPFFNIVTAAVNIWYRATDIDRKDIRIKPTKLNQRVLAFLATLHLQDWMRKTGFGSFLNEWGRTLARYGSAVSKFVEKDGELIPSIVPWNQLICDPVDFENNPKIEKLYLTPSQLRKNKAYDQDMVKELIACHQAKQAREDLNGQTRDNRNDYIEIYEVHGELELSYLTDDEKDDDDFAEQTHIVSFIAKDNKGDEYDEFCLYKGKSKDPYLISHLIKEDGRTMGIGAVEHLFDAQWMVNHSMKAIKDQLDLASQLIFQTSDGNYAGRNVLTDIITGDILIHDVNQPLTQIQNNSHDITSLQNFGAQWQALAKEITSTPDIMTGTALPSGTAWRQAQILQQESHSLFEIMTENKGLAIEEMCRRFIIPFNKKRMDTGEEIAATLSSQGITEFDAMYVPAEAVRRNNQLIKEASLRGEVIGQPNLDEIKTGIRQELDSLGSQRFIKPSDVSDKTWKDLLKDLEWEVEVEVTNENSNKDAVMTTLTTVLQTIAGNPLVLQDPNMKMLFNKIIEETGVVSSIELSAPSKPAVPPQLVAAPGQAPNQPTSQPNVGPNY